MFTAIGVTAHATFSVNLLIITFLIVNDGCASPVSIKQRVVDLQIHVRE